MKQCPYPTIRFIAWEQRVPGARIFVPDPEMRGRYILTDRCVALVPCEQCKSIPGEPCKGKQGYGAGTHYVRRHGMRWRGKHGEKPGDILKQPTRRRT